MNLIQFFDLLEEIYVLSFKKIISFYYNKKYYFNFEF